MYMHAHVHVYVHTCIRTYDIMWHKILCMHTYSMDYQTTTQCAYYYFKIKYMHIM